MAALHLNRSSLIEERVDGAIPEPETKPPLPASVLPFSSCI